MAKNAEDAAPLDTRSDPPSVNEFNEVTIEMTPDQLAAMIGQLVSNMSKPKEPPENPARRAFGSVTKNFSPNIQKYLLGETPGAYWLSPEVSASIAFFNRQKHQESEKPLPGEAVSAAASAPLRPTDLPAPPIHPKTPTPTLPTTPTPLPAPPPALSPIEQRLDDEGFLFSDQNLNRLIIRAAAQYSDTPVILVGPVGVGKSRLAGVLHHCYWENQDGDHPLIDVNCAQLDSALAESALFGHVKGAFTGAAKDHIGYLAQADGGTLFLDEFEELPMTIQAKLLQAIDPLDPLAHRFTPIGNDKPQASRFRLIVATNVEPKVLMEKRRLREDFSSRLGLHILRLPSLAQYPEKIAPLFWKIFDDIQKRRKTAIRPFDGEATRRLKEWLASGKGKWVNNRRDLVHAANELFSLAMENGGVLDMTCVDSLLETMDRYWEYESETGVLAIERDRGELKIRMDYLPFLEVCCGTETVQKIDPKRYTECFWLIWANLIGGSARKAGMIFYHSQYQNPSDKMKKHLRDSGLLKTDEKYETMLHSLQNNFLSALTDPDAKSRFADIFRHRPSTGEPVKEEA